MLKSTHPLPSGPPLAISDDMKHGNEIVIAEANFGAAKVARTLLDPRGVAAMAASRKTRRARQACAVIASGTRRCRGLILLRKGVPRP